MYLRFFLRVLISISFISFSQNETKDINWHERNILTWNDFKKVDNMPYGYGYAKANAFTRSGIKTSLGRYGDGYVVIKVTAYMGTNKSFVLRDYMSNYLLKHEQGHFNISEIFARKMRLRLKKAIINQIIFDNISDNIEKELRNYQKLYDKETNHSKNIEKQEEWDIKIANELKELEEYSNIYIKCLM